VISQKVFMNRTSWEIPMWYSGQNTF